MKDRTIRRLSALQKSGSSARTLNLAAISRRHAHDPALAAAPFFRNPLLSRCIVVKHRLRANEQDAFCGYRSQATKVLLPIDTRELRLGAQYFFVGQKDMDAVLEQAFGAGLRSGEHDRHMLELLDGLPSLDPFLLRDHLRRHGFEPAAAYFDISEADMRRMFGFVEAELSPLVRLSQDADGGQALHAGRLVDKLLSANPDLDFEPLRDTLRLEDREYLDGLFAWRGFLYYKWLLHHLETDVSRVLASIGQVRARPGRDAEALAYVGPARQRIQLSVRRGWDSVRSLISVYDKAYAGLVRSGRPQTFRDFLLTAPGMFSRLGEQLGAIQHVVSFWSYRFPEGSSPTVDALDLMDVFLDFEDSLAFARAPLALTAA
ncbi:hypothetical protein [Caulobacter sp. 17J65-9]|uniref:hypothetical protein n=1 Tax=Caulobacter sp. 17J65-9 TaxID=2709382 RepID=UPI0013C7DFB8|nr:hypothetical protein [Caulobacter sp. 17J65-9]NEX92752.1 hypothetical protein [Caulobacter sp. 17J65-9]